MNVHRRLPQFSEADRERLREFYPNFTVYDPTTLEEDMRIIAEAIEIEVTFEPFRQVGDVKRLLDAAANLFLFVSEYEDRTGTLDLPPRSW